MITIAIRYYGSTRRNYEGNSPGHGVFVNVWKKVVGSVVRVVGSE